VTQVLLRGQYSVDLPEGEPTAMVRFAARILLTYLNESTPWPFTADNRILPNLKHPENSKPPETTINIVRAARLKHPDTRTKTERWLMIMAHRRIELTSASRNSGNNLKFTGLTQNLGQL
jgi:hypothetical protein